MGMVCFGAVAAAMAEYEINLVRNPKFLPGLDRQGPRDWLYYSTTDFLDVAAVLRLFHRQA